MKTKIWGKWICACDQDQVIQKDALVVTQVSKDALVVTQVSKAVVMNLTSVHAALP